MDSYIIPLLLLLYWPYWLAELLHLFLAQSPKPEPWTNPHFLYLLCQSCLLSSKSLPFAHKAPSNTLICPWGCRAEFSKCLLGAQLKLHSFSARSHEAMSHSVVMWLSLAHMTWILLQPQSTHTFVIVTRVPAAPRSDAGVRHTLLVTCSSTPQQWLAPSSTPWGSMSVFLEFFSSLYYFPEPLGCPCLFYLPIVSWTSLCIQLFWGGWESIFSFKHTKFSYVPFTSKFVFL